ncbi:D-methionine transport system ATP-binding protein [Herbihabitans rhizosphaerae]|uniref:D-methionine transport system ATP-binding protein n=1 Tax=Herbihabitans rhizosphaerae TaxID=1872711 RepID=A0A4Q7KVW9_9PSEU|nr:ATP-binding cassette domain-containing protein [Herbihabitans rhizosphaerae]RZS40815.1 D-methionine transport system ATP-binding protein [Herbihabitans rhizosphaerae]
MITIEHLSKSFWGDKGPVLALRDVTLDVGDGAIAGVVGPSGSGKSTLARLLALQDRPDSGSIRFNGVDTVGLDSRRLRETKRLIGTVTGEDKLVAQRTAAGNIALPLEQAGIDGPQRRNKVGTLLDLIGLTDAAGAHPDTLSPGQQRRIALARALVGNPSVLLADDVTAGLDADAGVGVLTALDRARAELGVTVLLATTDAGAVRRVADDVAILDGGRVVESGTLLDLIKDPSSRAANTLLPALDPLPAATSARHDRIAEVLLVGFAAVGALLPEAGARFGVDIAVLGGGLTRLGDTPVARFRVGVTGERADATLAWITERGGHVHREPTGPQGVAA